MVPLGEEAQVEAHFWRLEMMLILTQDGCTVGAEHTIGLEIILDTPDVMRTSTPIIHPRRPRRHLLVLLLVLVLENLIIK